MLIFTQADVIHALIVSNFLYGALLLIRSQESFSLGAASGLWVTTTGAAGHLWYATMLPGGKEHDGTPAYLLMLDTLLVFATLFVFVITMPRLSHVVVDGVGGLIGF